MGFLDKLLGTTSESKLKKMRQTVNVINSLEPKYKVMTDDELRSQTVLFKERLKNGETLDQLLPEAFAAVREAAGRTVGMRPYDVQMLGGIVLHQGRIAEMKTGEGKTLVAVLPSYLNALEGRGVHVVTVNDYLASRDAQWMGKIHRFLGLSVGCITHELTSAERREAYNCDITYGTNNEFGFDYLRDNMVVYKEAMVQRELNFAIVDEVDSILIDEARTPLIISGQGEASSFMYREADRFVRLLTRGEDLKDISKSDQMLGVVQEESGDFMVDIRRRAVQLTAQGIAKAERFFKVESLADTDNTELNHFIQQALKAHALFTRDKDYVVQNGQVLIVDEFTGRLMIGRRYSDGLHQALEAKEGVKVEHENKTLATITFQNYFRMFRKLSGMTGTAKTEEDEFTAIYGLDVVEVPTNKPCIREDLSDIVYTTEKNKFLAVVDEIVRVHKTGQPILVGTVSVEKSELLSDMLKRTGVPHQVLNAKYHAKEAQIVAQAGKMGTVTIATNMAGRGTDILLGGNPDFMARQKMMQDGLEPDLIEEATGHAETSDEAILEAREKYKEYLREFRLETDKEHEQVISLGGLHIIGTERHESRRIDNQLRGRAGRQGDPGSTRFYVSLQDDLMRRFGGDMLENIMSKLNPGDETPIESKLVTRSIESAQKRVEMSNFETRKNVLRYDDVMNKQRSIIYGQRHQVLMGEDMHESFLGMLKDTADSIAAAYFPSGAPETSYNPGAAQRELNEITLTDSSPLFNSKETLTAKNAPEIILQFLKGCLDKKANELSEAGIDIKEVERVLLLRSVDTHWMDHIDAMDQLKQGIGLRAYAQKDPVVAYTNEGFDMFDTMVNEIREQTVKSLMRVQVKKAPVEREQIAKPIETSGDSGSTTVRKMHADKVGRNDLCPCGSGKKYKNCCGK